MPGSRASDAGFSLIRRHAGLAIAAAALVAGCRPEGSNGRPPAVVPNDNRVAGGVMRGDTLVFTLDASMGAWRPDQNVDSSLTVQAFASADGVPRIPGPLLRAPAGTVVEIHLANHLADSALVVHGLRPGTPDPDTLTVAAGGARVVHFTAADPGTYLYWGRTQGDRMEHSEGRDGPLSGAIVIDPAGTPPDRDERIFVITTLDILPDTTKPPPRDDSFDLALNGLSWPWTEALRHTVGDTVRWRVLNATATPHPMHLHGFHFETLAKGTGATDTLYPPAARRHAVTELLMPGHTARLRWVPTRAGRWLFHCHIVDHIVPFPPRADSVRRHQDAEMAGTHDASAHARNGMSGLVMGIEVAERAGPAPAEPAAAGGPIARRFRLLAQQSSAPPVDDTAFARGYVLQQGPTPPARDSIVIPGPPLVLTRGERTAVTVVNHLTEPTSVHWHGIELESVYDGVAGWSGAGSRRAPLIAPNDSFVAVMTPPRAGTFMYHPHMDEEDQLQSGMFGPLIVLEPGARFDPATDLVFMVGESLRDGKRDATLNGARTFAPLRLRAGISYRLRFLNLNSAAGATVLIHQDSVPLRWTPLAKDGAALASEYRREQPARLNRWAVGETYDFIWRPAAPLRAELTVHAIDSKEPFRVPIVVTR